MFQIKRVYLPPTAADGHRVLIDGLWPRGLSKQAAAVDLWLKEIAPSAELRRWFGHDPARWRVFRTRYRKELLELERTVALDRLRQAEVAHGTVTLLFGAREQRYNHAAVLFEVLKKS